MKGANGAFRFWSSSIRTRGSASPTTRRSSVPIVDPLRDEIPLLARGARFARPQRRGRALGRPSSTNSTPATLRPLPPPNGCEIGFQVAARDMAALRNGDYRVRPVFGLNTDGAFKTISRFADALGSGFADRLRRA